MPRTAKRPTLNLAVAGLLVGIITALFFQAQTVPPMPIWFTPYSLSVAVPYLLVSTIVGESVLLIWFICISMPVLRRALPDALFPS